MTSRERSGFIGKEKDAESGLGDFGVRKYDFLAGRFTSPDAMWEKYVGLTPYQYSFNNPIGFFDNNGKNGVAAVDNDNRTITVKADYIVNEGFNSADEVASLATTVNTTLNQANYSVSEGNYSGYSVKFDLQFHLNNDDNNILSTEGFQYQGVVIGNEYGKGSAEDHRELQPNFEQQRRGAAIGGKTTAHSRIMMNKDYNTTRNIIHEIFHTLFFDNDNADWGIGSYRHLDMPSQNDINKLINNDDLPKKEGQ